MESEKVTLQQEIENSFEMEIIGAYTLNFLIYIQNVYLNQNEDEFKFPYLAKKLLFKDNFEENFKKLWDEATQTIFNEGERADNKYFFDDREVFYERLFEKKLENLMIFHEVHTTFQTWWDSLVGKFTLERSVDAQIQKVYVDLIDHFFKKGEVPQQRLRLHLIFDDYEFGDTASFSYFVVSPLQEFSIRCDELAIRIKESID